MSDCEEYEEDYDADSSGSESPPRSIPQAQPRSPKAPGTTPCRANSADGPTKPTNRPSATAPSRSSSALSSASHHQHRPHTSPYRAAAPTATTTSNKIKPPVPLDNINPRYLSANNPSCWVAASGVGRVYSWSAHHRSNMQLAQAKAQAARYNRVLQATYRELEVQRVNQEIYEDWNATKSQSMRRSREEHPLTLPWAGYVQQVEARGTLR
jgi:hypothetical protein